MMLKIYEKLYRYSDFYEMFFDDAEIAASALGIALTRRGKNDGEDIPMCGVPVEGMDPMIRRQAKASHGPPPRRVLAPVDGGNQSLVVPFSEAHRPQRAHASALGVLSACLRVCVSACLH